jgi:5-methylcytosine-specific restriction endonuclease McrA
MTQSQESRAAYRAAYYAANKDKWDSYKAYKATYRANNKANISAYNAAYHAANRDKLNSRALAHYVTNRDKLVAYSTAYRAKNNDKIMAYKAANKDKIRFHDAKRRAIKFMQRCVCCTDADIQKMYSVATLCGPGAEVDHIVQLALGGAHCAKNLRAITAEEHKEKTKSDATLRADARRRNKLLRGWPRLTGELH